MDEGHPCPPKNLASAIIANVQMERTGKSENIATQSLDESQVGIYERIMGRQSKRAGAKAREEKPGDSQTKIYDQMESLGIDPDPFQHSNRPSYLLSKQAYDVVSTPLRAWVKRNQGRGDIQASREDYKESVVLEVSKIKEQIDTVFENSADPDMMTDMGLTPEEYVNRELKRLGLDSDRIYSYYDYLDFIEGGGPFFRLRRGGSAEGNIPEQAAATLTQNYGRFNAKWTLYNIQEILPKVVIHYGKNPIAVTQGVWDSLVATRGNLFAQVPTLKKQGVYGVELGLEKRRKLPVLDIFQRSNNVMDNLSWFIDKASGGDGWTGLKRIAFKGDAWDIPEIMRNASGRHTMGFMRFQLDDMNMYAGMLSRSFMFWKPRQAAANLTALVAYSTIKSALTGTSSAIPAPVWLAWGQTEEGKKIQKAIKDFDNRNNWTNLTEKFTGIDISDYSRPLGGLALGVTLDIFNSSIAGTALSGLAAAENAIEGKIKEAAVYGLDTILGLWTTGPWSSITRNGKAYRYLKDVPVIKDTGLPVVVKKVEEVMRDLVLGDIKPEEVEKELKKKLMGRKAVASEAKKKTTKPGLPALPKPPSFN